MALDFANAISVGELSDLVEVQRGLADEPPEIPSSEQPRGLALKALTVSSNWEGLWGLLHRRQEQEIYFLSVAFDLSGSDPLVLPPKDVPEGTVYRVRRGEKISFTLGDGAPLFPPQILKGGLIIYVTIAEADKGLAHVGEVMKKVHEDLSKDGSLTDVIKDIIKNPGMALGGQVLSAVTAALQPIATILQNNKDEYVALFTGIFAAKGPWTDQLSATHNQTTIELGELPTV